MWQHTHRCHPSLTVHDIQSSHLEHPTTAQFDCIEQKLDRLIEDPPDDRGDPAWLADAEQQLRCESEERGPFNVGHSDMLTDECWYLVVSVDGETLTCA